MQRISRYTWLIVLLGVMASCKKSFLEIKPKGRVIATKTSDYDLLLNNLSIIVISGADAQNLLGDEIAMKDPQWTSATLRQREFFKWQSANVYKSDEDAGETLTPMRGLYYYNKIIEEVMESTEGSEQTKKSLQAEALAGRAWTYLYLINFYGKPYNPATAATDPGFPLILKADVNGSGYTRATVQQVYDQIVTDLTTAIPNLTYAAVQHRSRMSQAAAKALLAKVYIFMGKFNEALPLLNESIATLGQSLVPTVLYNFNTAFPGFPTAVNDTENMYAKVMSNNYISNNNQLVWLTPEAAALYGPNDTRLVRWMNNSTTFPNGLKLLKRGNTTVWFWGVRVSETYLFRAEVKARLNDLSGAVSDLEFFRQNRMPVADSKVPADTASSQLKLLQFVLDERIREFAVAGYRWYDMRRLSVDPLFAGITFNHRVYGATGDVIETFTVNDPKNQLVLKFPSKILAENPGIVDNP